MEITWAVLAALFQFRIATAEQLRRLTAPVAGIEKMRARLRRLREEGLAEELVLPQTGRQRAWFLTEHGARVAGTFPELADIPAPRTPGDKSAFKYTLWHQLAVVRTHLVFLTDARKRGDAYGPFDFIPEITHRFAEGREGTVRPDGLLYYSRTNADDARVTNLAFVEVDRGTMGGPRLAAKLNAYARYWATAPLPAGVRPGTTEAQGGGVPLWERRYVHFPRLLFVLTGTGQAGFAHRADDLEAIAHTRHVDTMLRTVPARVAKLEDLEKESPGSDVWWSITDLEAGPGTWWS
ncbi:replication-relaxation family protein [Kitasatospora sp. MAA19]|uniref:replication-relaxation family protein n=1 Tax=Kitasatospora sp. MAA19 TaxID=3035090 RepID=UPI002472FA91|nr:replication-relaxation family protein [Kitasatospora sp. MAA19]